jgi:hypothetical protein
MEISLYYQTTEQKQQSFKIWTDVERAHSNIICPISAVLTPVTAYPKNTFLLMSISNNIVTIVLNGSLLTDPDDFG